MWGEGRLLRHVQVVNTKRYHSMTASLHMPEDILRHVQEAGLGQPNCGKAVPLKHALDATLHNKGNSTIKGFWWALQGM